jgi:hypothetical protein
VSSTRPAPSSGLESIAIRSSLGQLPVVERLRGSSERDRLLQENPIHVVTDQTLTEFLESSLRECLLGVAQAIEHHLPPQVDHRQLHRFSIGHPQVTLHQHGDRHACRAHRILARTGVAVHRLQRVLHLVIEDLVPVVPQEREQLARPAKALENRSLLPRVRLAWHPALDGHAAEQITRSTARSIPFWRTPEVAESARTAGQPTR